MQEQIIRFLKKSRGYISGEEISQYLKISRAGIWKYIQELRKDGYDIVAVPHLGYQLVSSPDKLYPHEIQAGLKTHTFGKKIIHYDTITSTMDAAFQLGLEGAKEGTVECAEGQSKGKGRLGRHWNSPKGKGIYMSMILRPALSPSHVAQITLLSAVVIAEAIKKECGILPSIKWPNDLLINELKVAGILTEMSSDMDRVRFVVVGAGINVNTPMHLLPPQATSLKNQTRHSLSRVKLLQEVLRSFEKWYKILNDQDFSPVIERWKQLSSTLGKQIRLVDQNGAIEGLAVNLDEHGGLVIRSHTGVAVKRISGDVIPIS